MPDEQDSREEQASTAERPEEKQGNAENQERRETGLPFEGEDSAKSNVDDDITHDERRCHRRGCDRTVSFLVLERYQEETGQGAVEATAALCRDHAAEESPTNLDSAYDEYVFRVDPVDSQPGSDVD